MYHTWFFQKRLAEALDGKLRGLKLLECFSQQKDELILGFADENKQLFVKADFGNNAGILSVQENFARARRNSVDLFDKLIDHPVEAVFCYKHERSFRIEFKQDLFLIFKMHGSRSNILLAEKNQVTSVFRNNLDRDMEIVPSELNNDQNLDSELTIRLRGRANDYQDLEMLHDPIMSICLEKGKPRLHFGTMPDCFASADPIDITNKFSEYFYRVSVFAQEKTSLENRIEKKITQTKNYLKKTSDKKSKLESGRSPEEIGHLIMAHMHEMREGEKEVVLKDFYSDEQVKIKLNPKLSPQKNAENYYRKSKNRKIEMDMLETNLKKKEEELDLWENRKLKVSEVEDLRMLRKLESEFFPENAKDRNQPKPYFEFEVDGWQILVGKHAKSNDELTQRIARKNDLWLHAKDVSGSHVVVKEHPGQNFPKDVIEKAAALAAYYSKRKTDSLCPVIFTPKKFVRKVKGAPAGQVMVDREEIVMVEPNNKL